MIFFFSFKCQEASFILIQAFYLKLIGEIWIQVQFQASRRADSDGNLSETPHVAIQVLHTLFWIPCYSL